MEKTSGFAKKYLSAMNVSHLEDFKNNFPKIGELPQKKRQYQRFVFTDFGKDKRIKKTL